MGKSIARKIIESHIVEGKWEPGAEIGIRIDQTLTQDATGTMTYLQFETMGVPRVRTDLSVSYIDHNVMQVGFENADDHRYLAGVAAKYGIVLSPAGNGICHQVHLERFGKPGATLLGADSHTPTGGGLGMLAIGAGGLDIAMAMAGKPFYLQCPKVIRIVLKGRLQPWVSAKDIVLKALEVFSTKGNVGCVFEYSGPGVATLSVPERATIANMGAECGVTSTVFPSDEATRAFLKSQGREADWRPLQADPDAEYDREVEFDLDALEPLVAFPHSPGNIRTARSFAGMKVDQVCVGSCTNSSFRDLATAAEMLRGRMVSPSVSFVVTPGSRQVLQRISRTGHLDLLIDAGARMVETSCSFCIGSGSSPASGAVSLRTSNRNFEARSGTKDAQVYLCSPETAVAAALTGVMTDPRDLGIPCPSVAPPEKFDIDDRMFVFPMGPEAAAKVEIPRGPNIGAPPSATPYPADLAGVVAIKVGDKITTDHIIPAGARMKYRSNIPAYSEYVFESVDPGFAARARAARDAGSHNVILAGQSYGQGSSREHASICPAHLGVRAVIAKSFERIHSANLVNFGIVPLTLENPDDYDRMEQGDRLEISGIKAAISGGAAGASSTGAGPTRIEARNATKGFTFTVLCALSARQRTIVAAGGLLAN